jgi:hypothetical protein
MDDSYANGLTAVAGGGQSTSATIGLISGQGGATVNRFTTVATGNDSATLPKAAPGLRYVIINAAASNSMNVFPLLGDAINALSANTAFALAANKTATFFCAAVGVWNVQLTA